MHNIKKTLLAGIMSCCAIAFAAEPDSHLETAKSYRARADQGDAEAMYLLAELLLQHGPEPGRADAATIEAWRPVGNRYTANQWIVKAADAGQPKAREILCATSKDPLAPASRREAGTKYCN